jgi:radical SAM superfamily enzyme YgiQ (UPF0313 family)
MKKIKVALILCPCWSNFCPPLGIAYLAAKLKKINYEVKSFDMNIELYNLWKNKDIDYWDFKEFYCWLEPFFSQQLLPMIRNDFKNKIKEILDYKPEIIGFSVFDTNASASLYLAEEIKKLEPKKKIIFGGQECFKEIDSHRFLNSGFVDAVVIGEGERTLEELLDIYSKSGEFSSDIKGVLLKKNGELISTGFREEIDKLDSLPMPDFDNFNLKQYKRFALPIMTSRGCVARCSFCGEIRYWKKYRFRTAENILAELKQGIIRYGVREFFFNDSLINGNLNELSKLADLIIENKLDIIWGGYARVNKKMDLDMLKRLKKAGCYFLSYGIESGSQKVLNDMNKMIILKDIEKNLADTTQAGIEAHVNWIVGFPTESWFDFLKSLLFIYKNKKNIFHFNPGQVPCGIPPDSGIAQNLKKFKIAEKPFLNQWRTKYFRNTIIHRKLRMKILRNWLSFLRISYT